MSDSQHNPLPRPSGEVEHNYGSSVHILSHPWAMTILDQLCSPNTTQPAVNELVEQAFGWLLTEVSSRELAVHTVESPTRMAPLHPKEGVYRGELIVRNQPAVVVDIARAGIIPGLVFYNRLNHLLEPSGVRQDHIFMNRVTDDTGQVIGVNLSGSKIGGDVEGATVLIPDPMAATGSSIASVLRMYQDTVEGTARRIVVVHLIITPEYIKRITDEFHNVQIYAIRLDRGLSSDAVLQSKPGAETDGERGLNENHYIVPGGGGLGEVINNAWV
jgi:uracil phosphoribosyltransferase